MPYALFMNDRKISGPFQEKSEAWADAGERGLDAEQLWVARVNARCQGVGKDLGGFPSRSPAGE